MVDPGLAAMPDDPVDVVRAERMPRLKGPDRIQRGMAAADARVELQRDPQGLEALAEAAHQLRAVEAVGGARERRAEPAILAFEDVDDAGEPAFREQGAVKPALPPPSRPHALPPPPPLPPPHP